MGFFGRFDNFRFALQQKLKKRGFFFLNFLCNLCLRFRNTGKLPRNMEVNNFIA